MGVAAPALREKQTIRYRMLSRVENANVRSGQRAARPNLPQLRTFADVGPGGDAQYFS
jgi:hypothetical protein